MNWRKNLTVYGVLVFALPILMGEGSLSEEETKVVSALDEVLPYFEVEDKRVGEFLSEINKLSKVPVNAEIVVNEAERHSMSVRNVRLRDLLTQYTQKANLKWCKDSRGITIIARDSTSDPEKAMTSTLAEFETKSKNKADSAMRLFSHPDIVGKEFYITFAQSHRVGTACDAVFDLHLNNVTPREVLGAIVEADGKSYWVLTTTADGSRYLSFGSRSQQAANGPKGKELQD